MMNTVGVLLISVALLAGSMVGSVCIMSHFIASNRRLRASNKAHKESADALSKFVGELDEKVAQLKGSYEFISSSLRTEYIIFLLRTPNKKVLEKKLVGNPGLAGGVYSVIKFLKDNTDDEKEIKFLDAYIDIIMPHVAKEEPEPEPIEVTVEP